jgi:thymidylate synthase
MEEMDEKHAELEQKSMGNLARLQILLRATMVDGHEIAPRGLVIKEMLNPTLDIHPEFPFQTFRSRNYNIEYFKKEMLWKLGASKFDDSIKAHAKMWESVQNPDGSFNSNYGQYWFGQQMGLMKAVLELIRDKDSRRASIPMLTDAHLSPETTDTVCTEAVTFHIRANLLLTTVHMRSSDQIFGLGTDLPTFSVLAHLALGLLRPYYGGLGLGPMTVVAASSHIYSRHFRIVEDILEEDIDTCPTIQLPMVNSAAEALAIIAHRGKKQKVPDAWRLYEFIYG